MLEKIENSCKYVMANSKDVKINYQLLDTFIKEIKINKDSYWLCNNPYDLFSLGIEKVVNFLLIFEAIDYCFWGSPKWQIDTSEGPKDGCDALMYALLRYVKKTDNFDFSAISLDEFKGILKGNVEVPFLHERYNAVKEISEVVNKKMQGNFYNYIKKITLDKDLFNIIILSFPCFKDEREYQGKTIYFYKLAQLLTTDILILRKKLEKIDVNYSHLKGCADYKIPQTLRAMGITKYSKELAQIVDSKKLMAISSKYEVEIRSSQIAVISYIQSKLPNLNAMDINNYFFGYAAKVKNMAKPYHLCANINY